MEQLTPSPSTATEHTVRKFDEELADLNALVLQMGGVVQDQIKKALDALKTEDMALARDVIVRDHVVNFFDVQADERSVELLALRQPMAKDLRMILSLGKTVTDLERIGDEAERIARMVVAMYSSDTPPPNKKLLQDIHVMAKLADAMLKDTLDALARLNVDAALEVARRDAELDAVFQSALRRLATYVMEDSRNVGHTINVTFVLRSLERIGDHTKNIAEYVIYLVKGKDIRHISPDSLSRSEL